MATTTVKVLSCQHIKANGVSCGSPALRKQSFCHFHQQWRPMTLTGTKIALPLLEDAASIQLAITQVTHLLLNFMIDHKTAGLVLYGLQVASSNLRNFREEKREAAEEAEAQAKQPVTTASSVQEGEEEPVAQDGDPLSEGKECEEQTTNGTKVARSSMGYQRAQREMLNCYPEYTMLRSKERRQDFFGEDVLPLETDLVCAENGD